MKCYFVFAIVLIAVILQLQETQGWRRRWRVRWPRIRVRLPKIICRVGCGKTCVAATGGTGALLCYFPCKKICSKKRENTLFDAIPRDFNTYDTNKDGAVDIKELATVTKVQPSKLKDAFEMADENDNGRLDKDEFETAPWFFDGTTTDVDAKDEQKEEERSYFEDLDESLG